MGLLSFLDPPKKRRRPLVAQSILFDRSLWTVAQARAWLARHGHHSAKVHTTARMHRFRQHAPAAFVKGSFRTLVFGKGIEAVAGHVKVRR